uniref:DUF4604 domain-containing protein n=1 Tax=Ciona intestinalis TaxID=7719 RepID=H2Y0C6_CIOIN|nr:uncharacterized protein KIAA1143 homolog [Ciona intestinalis]|eukprot:XP_002128812.1 uncharacterized protein KIAA1143 homolog [Ciona intestinalis]
MSKKFQFIKQEQPKFITQFKKKAGLIKEPEIDDKNRPSAELDDRDDNDDEQPVIVVLKDGDLNKKEYEKEKDTGTVGGKIVFKQPATKRSAEEKGLSASSKKMKANSNPDKKDEQTDKKTKTKKGTKSKTAPVLSFNEEEEDDDV